ncbi:hypothetical protein FB567DRAFT_316940 [Paraphoma chrysanthemicola]|uniref:Uncharacterized protein n=1 Tax=Paraphoma chrysanthemicola TaxID=798071 RepID=A0A8K0VZ54_9PLEO|nr:hypothetical protein FB567DRAFT_316940 [Paraphoma chrysanthemicola]
MSSPSSSHSSDEVSVHDAELVKLRDENRQLRASCTTKDQEVKEWSTKYRDEKEEKLKLVGSRSAFARELQSAKDLCSSMEAKLVLQDRQVEHLSNELSKARMRLRDSQLPAHTGNYTGTNEYTEEKIRALQMEVELANEDVAKLSLLHQGQDCVHFKDFAQRQLKDAMDEVLAAQAEVEALRHLGEGNGLIEEQNASLQVQLAESLKENSQVTADLEAREKEISLLKTVTHKCEIKYSRLEADLRKCQAEADQWRELAEELDKPSLGLAGEIPETTTPAAPLKRTHSVPDHPPSPPTSSTTSKGVPDDRAVLSPSQDTLPVDNRIDANVTINISPTNRKSWNFLKRLQSTITSKSALDIVGPDELVADLVAGMQACEDDHTAQTAAATHWQVVATKAMEEINNLNARPDCIVPSHRGLKDELAARDIQLQLQAAVVSQWQRKMANVHAFIDDANAEMRARGMNI